MPLDFDGSNDVMNCRSNSTVNNIVSKTICAWINADTYGELGRGRIMGKQNWNFSIDSGGFIRYSNSFSSGTNGLWRSETASFNTGALTHVAVTYTRSDTANIARFYINGISSATTTVTQPNGVANAENAFNLLVGGDGSGGSTFDGQVEEFALWNVILTPFEINLIAVSRIKRFCLQVRRSSLVMYLPVDDLPNNLATTSSAMSIRDISGNSNHGAPSSGPISRASILSYA